MRSQAILFRICVIMTMALAGCTVRSAPEITSSQGMLPAVTEVSILDDNEGSSTRNSFQTALKSELAANNIALKDDAEWIVDFSISRNDAESPLHESDAGEAQEAPQSIVTASSSSWTDACDAERARASLVVYGRADGNLAQQSVAEAIMCEGDPLPLTELARILVLKLVQR